MGKGENLGMTMLMEVVPIMERALIMVLMVMIWTAVMIMLGMDLMTLMVMKMVV